MGNSSSSNSTELKGKRAVMSKPEQPSTSKPERPSDEAILRYEEEIKQVEVDSFPMVSELLPIHVLRVEYEEGAEGFRTKLEVCSTAFEWNIHVD